jgi:hypothetical protein
MLLTEHLSVRYTTVRYIIPQKTIVRKIIISILLGINYLLETIGCDVFVCILFNLTHTNQSSKIYLQIQKKMYNWGKK